MDFFSGIGNFFGGLFGGRKKEDEERPRATVRQPAPFTLPQQSNTPLAGPTVQMPKEFQIPTANQQQPWLNNQPQLGGVKIKPPTAKEQELKTLYDKNIEQARQEQKQGMGFLDHVTDFMAGGAAEKRAQVQARNRAASQFQDKHGWNADPEILKYTGGTLDKAKANSESTQQLGKNLSGTRDFMEEWVDTASKVPIIGSIPAGIVKGGTALAGGIAAGTGNDDYANELGNSLTRMQLGMSPEEFNLIPADQRRKLEIMQQVDLGLIPLDYLGLSSILKSPLIQTGKQAAIEGATTRTISEATKQALIQGAKTEGRNMAAFGAAGGALSAGAQQYLGGDIDGGQTFKDTIISGMLAPLFSGPTAGARAGFRRGVDDVISNAASSVDDAPRPNPMVEAEEIIRQPTTPRDPNSPITQSPTTNKAPAITSPNRPAATVQQPQQINVPETVGTQPPVLQQPVEMPAPAPVPAPAAMPEVQAPRPMTPDEATIAAQKAIDEAATQPAPVAPEVASAPAEAPSVAEARAIAESAIPVNTEAVAASTARQAANQAPTEAIADDLGSMAQSAIQSGQKLDDAGWEALAKRVGDTANSQAEAIGTDIPTIMDKVQRAWESKGKVKTAKDAGLSEAEFNLYQKTLNEMNYLRERADPSLLSNNAIGRWYSPRQATDSEYTPDLVNEISRGGSGVGGDDLDLTTTPIEHYIRRYGNAEKVVVDNLVHAIENVSTKDANGVSSVTPSGLKVSSEAKAKLETGTKEYIAKKDAIEQALVKDDVSVKDIDNLTRQMDDDINKVFSELIDSIPKNTAEGREAIQRLTTARGAYLQSTIRSNMFSNIVNRSMDQVQAGLVKSTNTMLGVADSLVSASLRQNGALAKGRAARSVAREYSKGALFKQIGADFRTNMALGEGTKIGRAYRAGSTALTSAGDLTKVNVKTANLAMLARAQAEGITGRAELAAYLRKNLNSPEYKELLTGISDVYAGYVSLPTSIGSRVGKPGGKLSRWDNAIANSEKLKEWGVSPRARRELNDLVMPALTGFAAATRRVGGKSLNSAALGVPGMIKGLKIAREGGESARQIGQIMIARSLVDGAVGGTAAAATTAAMVAGAAEWTGSYPSDPNERARWQAQGIQENALSFDMGNGEKLQIQPGRLLGAFALPIVLPAVLKSGGDVGEVIDGTMGQMLENMGVDSALQNAASIGTALTGSGHQRDAAWNKLLGSAGFSMSAMIPASGALNNVANATDDVKRDTSGGVVDVIKNRVPGFRQSLDEKTDNLGNPIRNNVQGSLGSSVISTSKAGDTAGANPLNDEINRLAKAEFEVMPGKDVKNSNSQNDARLVLESDIYKGADDERKSEILREALLGTRAKDIHKDLEDADRKVLLEHLFQNEDQRKVWLEDNENAFGYYKGKFANKQANGTLTADDQDMGKTGSLIQQMVGARVDYQNDIPQELTQLYKNTTKTEFNKMSEADQQKLIDYDKKRVAAGLPSKFQNSKGGYGKAGGSGRKGSDKFAFAQLPSSLIGTGGGSGSGSGYAKEAPLFKPIPDLKAPAGKAIPKGRTISVKKGIQI